VDTWAQIWYLENPSSPGIGYAVVEMITAKDKSLAQTVLELQKAELMGPDPAACAFVSTFAPGGDMPGADTSLVE